jgi:hypothetical protein
MKLKMGLRIILAAALAWAVLGSVGCGQMARDAIKTGISNYVTDVSGTFNFGGAFDQLTSLVTGTLTGGGGGSSLFQ